MTERKQVGWVAKDVLDRVDEVRGPIPRARWVEQALRRSLDEDPFSPVGGKRLSSVAQAAPLASLAKRDVRPIPKGE
jgi:hypothetical protein